MTFFLVLAVATGFLTWVGEIHWLIGWPIVLASLALSIWLTPSSQRVGPPLGPFTVKHKKK